ncbi:hypothetical protein OK349_09860 [Sphingomonas sp. BT-65]|uniref:alpha-1,3-galactosidase-related protein n=1 Tax=Sphingomonas sp. BT-65 TaxID=2989821 RepID=UPI00223630E7|nr:hypothetical protein [Sphingomonas sp. BT-65]MCW4462011.1 hypothetical protein [Sphingomonas sp. BT-65]
MIEIRRRTFGGGLLAALSLPSAAAARLRPDKAKDMTPIVRAELDRLARQGGGTLSLPAGEHHFWPDAALVRDLYISNNDPGRNQIIFPVDGHEKLTIDGNGSRLVFHGEVTPFVLLGARDITLRNFEIDWDVPFHCEGDVLAADPGGGWVEIHVPEPFSYRLDAEGQFHFHGEGFERTGIGNILAFDRVRHETAYQVADNFFLTRDGKYVRKYKVSEIAPRRLRIEVPGKFRDTPEPGQRVVLQPRRRKAPAIHIANSDRVKLERVAIRHAGCMGVIAQLSSDISLDQCEVRPRPDSGRYVSTMFDATHFVNCSGTIALRGCHTSNHIDDGLNVHGIFLPILSANEAGLISAERADFQQHGIDVLARNDAITIADATTLEIWYRGKVKSVRYPDDRQLELEVVPPLPRAPGKGDVINNLSRNPDVIFSGGSIGKNRARGVLVSTAGKVLIEKSRFHAPGSAIRVSSGVDHWYESGPASEVVIRDNEFDNCRYGLWGEAVIDIVAVDGKDSTSTVPYHGRVAITGNRFATFDGLLVHAYRTAELVFRDNRIEASTAYPPFRTVTSPIQVNAVGKLDIANNEVKGFNFASLSKVSEQTHK